MVLDDFDEIKKRISIEDILLDCGFQPIKNRMPCPLHNGNNPTSFSFTDHVYHCHSCGASGGLLDLVEELFGYNRQEALKYLANKSGISLNNYSSDKISKQKRTLHKKTIPKQSARLNNLQLEYKMLNILRNHYTWQTREVRTYIRNRTIELPRYYTTTQYAEYALEELDSEIISINYEINSEKKKLRKLNKD